MTPDPIISLKDVTRWYGPVIALNDVSLQVGSGVTGLLGPNGAGKSTLLKLVTGQIVTSLGSVTVFGQHAFQNPACLTRVGFCPDIDRFNDDWTAFDFVEAAAYLCGFSRTSSRQRAEQMLDLVGLGDAASRRLASYSKGMRQRAKLAQALVNDPEVLVLDEPLTGLDPVARHEMVNLIRSLGDQGRCVVVSSHVLHEIEAMTDRVVLIHHGKLLAEGLVREIRSLLDRYPHQVTVEVDRPRQMAERLVAQDGVTGIQLEEQRLTLETRSPEMVFKVIEGLVVDDEYAVTRLFTRDDSLEAVFDYLVS